MATWTPKNEDEDYRYHFQGRNGTTKVRELRFSISPTPGYVFIHFAGTKGYINAGGCVPPELMDQACKDYLESRGCKVIDSIPNADDYCPICGAEIEMSEWQNKHYIYCPKCGPIPELVDLTELDDDHILGYPPLDPEDSVLVGDNQMIVGWGTCEEQPPCPVYSG